MLPTAMTTITLRDQARTSVSRPSSMRATMSDSGLVDELVGQALQALGQRAGAADLHLATLGQPCPRGATRRPA